MATLVNREVRAVYPSAHMEPQGMFAAMFSHGAAVPHDLFFKVGGDSAMRCFSAHKLIMAAKCQSINFMISQSDQHTVTTTAECVPVRGMQLMIEYCYTGQLHIFGMDDALAVLKAADYFGLLELREQAFCVFQRSITLRSSLKGLEKAINLKIPVAIQYVAGYVDDRITDIIDAEAYGDVSVGTFGFVLSRDTLNVASEDELSRFAVKYADYLVSNKQKLANPSKRDRRLQLKDSVFHLRIKECSHDQQAWLYKMLIGKEECFSAFIDKAGYKASRKGFDQGKRAPLRLNFQMNAMLTCRTYYGGTLLFGSGITVYFRLDLAPGLEKTVRALLRLVDRNDIEFESSSYGLTALVRTVEVGVPLAADGYELTGSETTAASGVFAYGKGVLGLRIEKREVSGVPTALYYFDIGASDTGPRARNCQAVGYVSSGERCIEYMSTVVSANQHVSISDKKRCYLRFYNTSN